MPSFKNLTSIANDGTRSVPTTSRKVAGYGSPGRFAKPCDHKSCGFDSHAFRFGSMVKRTSCLVSTEEFRVQILVELLNYNFRL